jgi:hypothetical protein
MGRPEVGRTPTSSGGAAGDRAGSLADAVEGAGDQAWMRRRSPPADGMDIAAASRLVLPSALRKFALATHLTVSVGWIGAIAGYLALDVTVATSGDPSVVRPAWIAMGLVASWAIVPLAFASVLTGLVMALGTKWGLFRHWWVLISFLLTLGATGVLLSETSVISDSAAMAADPATPTGHLLALPSTLPHSVGGLAVLLVVQVLNVYKPQGMTPYGWRKHQEERRRREQRRAGVRL